MEKKPYEYFFGKDARTVTAAPGIERTLLGYSESTMVCRFRLEKGAVIPDHVHPHQQFSTVISGKLSYTVGEECYEMGPGDSVMIAGDVPHSITVLEDSLAVDVFSPMREDYL